MKTVNFTQFRNQASGLLNDVEKGETLVVIRHGRPIAEVFPIKRTMEDQLSWKRPALRLVSRGSSLSEVIMKERERENVL